MVKSFRTEDIISNREAITLRYSVIYINPRRTVQLLPPTFLLSGKLQETAHLVGIFANDYGYIIKSLKNSDLEDLKVKRKATKQLATIQLDFLKSLPDDQGRDSALLYLAFALIHLFQILSKYVRTHAVAASRRWTECRPCSTHEGFACLV